MLLSSLVGFYSRWQADVALARENHRAVERLDREIGYRLSRVFGILNYLADNKGTLSASELSEIFSERPDRGSRHTLMGTAEDPKTVSVSFWTTSLFPEFTDYSLQSLLSELTRFPEVLAEHPPPQNHINYDPAYALIRLVSHVSNLPIYYEVRKLNGDWMKLATALNDDIILPR